MAVPDPLWYNLLMALPDLWSKLKEGGAKAVIRPLRTVLEFCSAKFQGGKSGGLKGKVSVPVSAVSRRMGELLRKLPPGGRKPVFIGFGVLLAALFLFLLILPVLSRDGQEGKAVAPELPARIIPPEDLFLPEEPDFVPSFLPGQERRESWTEEDAAVYWQDPLGRGEEEWRNRIESVVDGILERVP